MGTPKKAAGSHLDLPATLIELVAMPGFEYFALGEDLFKGNPKQTKIGIGKGKIITSEFIAHASGKQAECLVLSQTIEPQNLETLSKRHHQANGIAWWLIKKGNEIE